MKNPMTRNPVKPGFILSSPFPKKRQVNFVYTLSFIYLLSRLLTVEAFKISLD